MFSAALRAERFPKTPCEANFSSFKVFHTSHALPLFCCAAVLGVGAPRQGGERVQRLIHGAEHAMQALLVRAAGPVSLQRGGDRGAQQADLARRALHVRRGALRVRATLPRPPQVGAQIRTEAGEGENFVNKSQEKLNVQIGNL
jgi:hypothetical protein